MSEFRNFARLIYYMSCVVAGVFSAILFDSIPMTIVGAMIGWAIFTVIYLFVMVKTR